MKIIGHRGANRMAPENTVASLKKALEFNIDGLEFDLRVTKDGVVVLHHDPELKDASGITRTISQCTLQELKQHKPDIPAFEEVLDEIGPDVTLYIEIKPNVPVPPIIDILKKYLKKDRSMENMFILSYSPQILAEVKVALPGMRLMVNEDWSGLRATYRARKLGTKYVDFWYLWVWSGFIKSLTKRGWLVYANCLNDPAKAERWKRAGLKGVITDCPDRFASKK